MGVISKYTITPPSGGVIYSIKIRWCKQHCSDTQNKITYSKNILVNNIKVILSSSIIRNLLLWFQMNSWLQNKSLSVFKRHVVLWLLNVVAMSYIVILNSLQKIARKLGNIYLTTFYFLIRTSASNWIIYHPPFDTKRFLEVYARPLYEQVRDIVRITAFTE